MKREKSIMERRLGEMKKEKQLEKDLKQRLENLPRFGYKTIRFFQDRNAMQKAIDYLMNNNIMNLSSKTLTDNYINEIYDMYIFMPKEWKYTLIGSIIGGIIGAILGIFQGKTKISLPIFNFVSSGGSIVTMMLGLFIGATLIGTFVAIAMLFKPIKEIKKGYGMLTIYASIEDKKNIEEYLKKYGPIKL